MKRFHSAIQVVGKTINSLLSSNGLHRSIPLWVLVSLLVSCSQKSIDPAVLAKIGSMEIRVDEFQRELESRKKSNRPLISKEALLGEMIHQKALLARARMSGLESDPELQRAYNNLLVSKLKERELTPRVESASVSPEEIRQRYDENISQYTRPAKARLAMLFLKAEPTMTAQQWAELKARMDEARTLAAQLPADTSGFGALAVNYSEDQVSRYKGGDIGWLDEGQSAYRWPLTVVSAGFVLRQKGELSEVIQTDKGFYLVTKLDSRPSVVTPVEQVEEVLRRRLLADKRQRIEQSFAQEVRGPLLLTTNLQAFAAIEPFAPTVAKRKETEPPALP